MHFILHSNTSFNIPQSTHHRTYFPNKFFMRFLPRNWVTVFVIKEYGGGVSTFISACISCCDGLREGVAFVVKCKKSKITLKIMNVFQFLQCMQ